WVAAICHGPQLLIEADAVRGRQLTSWPSVRKDLENTGATWIDRDVVRDGNLITSREPADLDAFCDAVLRALARCPAEFVSDLARQRDRRVDCQIAGRGIGARLSRRYDFASRLALEAVSAIGVEASSSRTDCASSGEDFAGEIVAAVASSRGCRARTSF